MAGEKSNIKIVESQVIDAECKLPIIDRLRLLFGSTFYVTTVVHLPRRLKIQTQTKYGVSRFFHRAKIEGSQLAEQEQAP